MSKKDITVSQDYFINLPFDLLSAGYGDLSDFSVYGYKLKHWLRPGTDDKWLPGQKDVVLDVSEYEVSAEWEKLKYTAKFLKANPGDEKDPYKLFETPFDEVPPISNYDPPEDPTSPQTRYFTHWSPSVEKISSNMVYRPNFRDYIYLNYAWHDNPTVIIDSEKHKLNDTVEYDVEKLGKRDCHTEPSGYELNPNEDMQQGLSCSQDIYIKDEAKKINIELKDLIRPLDIYNPLPLCCEVTTTHTASDLLTIYKVDDGEWSTTVPQSQFVEKKDYQIQVSAYATDFYPSLKKGKMQITDAESYKVVFNYQKYDIDTYEIGDFQQIIPTVKYETAAVGDYPEISAPDVYFDFTGFDSNAWIQVVQPCEISALKVPHRYSVEFFDEYNLGGKSLLSTWQTYRGSVTPPQDPVHDKWIFKNWSLVMDGYDRPETNAYSLVKSDLSIFAYMLQLFNVSVLLVKDSAIDSTIKKFDNVEDHQEILSSQISLPTVESYEFERFDPMPIDNKWLISADTQISSIYTRKTGKLKYHSNFPTL